MHSAVEVIKICQFRFRKKAGTFYKQTKYLVIIKKLYLAFNKIIAYMFL